MWPTGGRKWGSYSPNAFSLWPSPVGVIPLAFLKLHIYVYFYHMCRSRSHKIQNDALKSPLFPHYRWTQTPSTTPSIYKVNSWRWRLWQLCFLPGISVFPSQTLFFTLVHLKLCFMGWSLEEGSLSLQESSPCGITHTPSSLSNRLWQHM